MSKHATHTSSASIGTKIAMKAECLAPKISFSERWERANGAVGGRGGHSGGIAGGGDGEGEAPHVSAKGVEASREQKLAYSAPSEDGDPEVRTEESSPEEASAKRAQNAKDKARQKAKQQRKSRKNNR